MGFSLKKAREQKMPLVVHYAGERLKLDYFPGKLDDNWQEKFDEAQSTDDSKEGISRMANCLADVIASWDMTDDEDKAVPVTGDAMVKARIPMPLYGVLNQAILRDAADGSRQAKKASSSR